MMTFIRKAFRRTSLMACLLAVPAPDAFAASSAWTTVHGGAVRLISAGKPEDGSYSAGLEFSLEPGWHTYWRYPGEAGIPPALDPEGSVNLGSLQVSFPAPVRHDDGFSTTYVYNDQIVLPLDIKPGQPDEPVELTLHVAFGICNDICVPGEADLSLHLSPDDAKDESSERLIERDRKAVPKFTTLHEAHIVSVQPLPGAKSPAVSIRAKVESSDPSGVDLFAEGPEGSYIGAPVFEGLEDGTAVWRLDLRGLKEKDGVSELRLVLKDGTRTEESVHPVGPELLGKRG